MNEELLQETDIEVMPFREAIDYVQSLEARGDFKYKGIYSLFNSILEATQKFQMHKILPNTHQIFKETPLPKEKVEEYLRELTGRGSVRAAVVVAFPSVEFVVGSNSLFSHTILCRPLQQDLSYRRYYDYYKMRSLDAIKKWLQRKGSKWQGDHREYVIQNLTEERYHNSHAGGVLHYYLQCSLDVTSQEKATTYRIFVKPLIQELINQKLLLYIKKENFVTLQFPDEDSLQDRLSLVLGKLRGEVEIPFSVSGQIENLEKLQDFLLKNQPRSKLLYLDCLSVVEHYITLLKTRQEEITRQKIQKALDELSHYEWVVPAQSIKSLSELDFVSFLSRNEVLHTEFLFGGKVMDFLLHKKNAYAAFLHARKQFYEKQNDTELRILIQMGISKYLTEEQLKIYESTEEDFLFSRLPWYIRVLRIFFGKEKLKKEEKEALKKELTEEEQEKQIQKKRKEIKEKTKEIIKEKKERKEDEEQEEIEKIKEQLQKDEKIERLLEKILDVLDEAWDRKELPNRLTLMERIEEFKNNEEALISFLKKHGRGKIFSFRIIPHNIEKLKNNPEDPKYLWPVLITKRYIARHGNRLLKEAMEEVDAQKKALMPDQEKFNIASSIEDFLLRVLSKKG